MTELLVTEATTSVAPQAVEGKSNRLLVGLITPGQGSSGYYAPEVLEAASKDKVFAAGTHMYLDHPTESEEYERPERSVRDLAAVLTEDARWDGTGLVAEAEVFGPYAPAIVAMKDHIGVSIRASAEVHEAAPHGRVIDRLVQAESVDFVTKAGRGGSIMAVLESARPRVNERAVAHGVEEATVNDRREALGTILKDTYSAEKTWVWLRDFDDSTAWFEVESEGEGAGVYQQTYTVGEDDLPNALSGERVEVKARTEYVPVAPAGQSINTTESQEDIMATTQIEEAELSGLREQAGRVEALESERDQAVQERDEARAALAQAAANTAAQESARARVRESNADLAAPIVERIVAEAMRDVPLGENHELDTEAWQRRVDECRTAEEGYLASLAEAQGAGTVTGFGPSAPQNDEASLRESNEKQRREIFGRTTTKEA